MLLNDVGTLLIAVQFSGHIQGSHMEVLLINYIQINCSDSDYKNIKNT